MENTQYQTFRSMDSKVKLRMIKEASQHEKWRKDNPQGQWSFREENFIDFEVYQEKMKLSLRTFRHYKSEDISDAVGVVFMFHGLNSHMGHGAHIAEALGQNGFITVGFDHRGFGKSEGQKGYVESLETHVYDSLLFTKKVKEMYPNLPAFALGLSMGGMTSYYLSLRYKHLFRGVIMMAPAIKNIVGGYLISFVNGLASLFHKKFRLPIKPPRGQATRNPKITEDVYNDPHAYTANPCMKTLKMLISTMDVTPKTFPQYDASFVIIQGGLDKLVHPDGAFQLYDRCKSKDKSIWFYEEMWHDIWHEEEITEIVEKTIKWLLERVPKQREGEESGVKRKDVLIHVVKETQTEMLTCEFEQATTERELKVEVRDGRGGELERE